MSWSQYAGSRHYYFKMSSSFDLFPPAIASDVQPLGVVDFALAMTADLDDPVARKSEMDRLVREGEDFLLHQCDD